MKTYLSALCILWFCFVGDLNAQRRDGPPRGRPGQPGEQFGGRRDRGPGRNMGPERDGFPPNPLFETLDTDRDGKLSAAEIASASSSLMTLDADSDGELTVGELRPQSKHRDGRKRRGGSSRHRRDGPTDRRPRPFDANVYSERILTFDKNGDSQVSTDELPDRMKSLMRIADSSKDGVLDIEEIQAIAE